MVESHCVGTLVDDEENSVSEAEHEEVQEIERKYVTTDLASMSKTEHAKIQSTSTDMVEEGESHSGVGNSNYSHHA